MHSYFVTIHFNQFISISLFIKNSFFRFPFFFTFSLLLFAHQASYCLKTLFSSKKLFIFSSSFFFIFLFRFFSFITMNNNFVCVITYHTKFKELRRSVVFLFHTKCPTCQKYQRCDVVVVVVVVELNELIVKNSHIAKEEKRRTNKTEW